MRKTRILSCIAAAALVIGLVSGCANTQPEITPNADAAVVAEKAQHSKDSLIQVFHTFLLFPALHKGSGGWFGALS